MARRKNQIFNLSFLDLLTSALGAIIFLFIITPKGGKSAAQERQAVVFMDTTQMKIFGSLPDSLKHKQIGDTLLTVLVDYQPMPGGNDKPKKVYVTKEPQPKQVNNKIPIEKPAERQTSIEKKPVQQPEKTPSANDDPKPQDNPKPTITYKGDAPSVPCKVSFELNWQNADDNVDLFVCKGNSCVYGGRKKDRLIGQWDSGKSRNRLFGNDLRTNQEAVRQFDYIVPGEYKIYAQLKESERNSKSVRVSGLIYTKDKTNNERGESFSKTIKLGEDRVLLGVVTLEENGNFKFKKQ